MGRVSTYGGGGYVADLGISEYHASKQIKQLISASWIDRLVWESSDLIIAKNKIDSRIILKNNYNGFASEYTDEVLIS